MNESNTTMESCILLLLLFIYTDFASQKEDEREVCKVGRGQAAQGAVASTCQNPYFTKSAPRAQKKTLLLLPLEND